MSMRKARQHKARRTHPGVMLLDDFLPEYGLTLSGFANCFGCLGRQ